MTTNNDLQSTTQKTKDRITRAPHTYIITGITTRPIRLAAIQVIISVSTFKAAVILYILYDLRGLLFFKCNFMILLYFCHNYYYYYHRGESTGDTMYLQYLFYIGFCSLLKKTPTDIIYSCLLFKTR